MKIRKILIIFMFFIVNISGLILFNMLNVGAIPYFAAYRSYYFLFLGFCYLILNALLLEKLLR